MYWGQWKCQHCQATLVQIERGMQLCQILLNTSLKVGNTDTSLKGRIIKGHPVENRSCCLPGVSCGIQSIVNPSLTSPNLLTPLIDISVNKQRPNLWQEDNWSLTQATPMIPIHNVPPSHCYYTTKEQISQKTEPPLIFLKQNYFASRHITSHFRRRRKTSSRME